MKIHRRLVIHLAICGSLAAQSTTIPPGWDTTEGKDPNGTDSYSYILGHYAAMRAQVGNADRTGKGAMIMNEIALRVNGSRQNAAGIGRSWANVNLSLSDTDVAKMTGTWSTNILSTPTMVFSGTRSWPDNRTPPTTVPAPWGVPDHKFPFNGLYLHPSTNDLLLDFVFTGGTFANNASWGPGPSGAKTYYQDGVSYSSFASGLQSRAGVNARNNPCVRDSNSTRTTSYDNLSYFYHNSYAKQTGSPTTANKMSHYFRIRFFRPSITVLQGASLGGTTSLMDPRFPVVPGLGCHNLMIDLAQMFQINTFITNGSGDAQTTEVFYNYVASAVGLTVYTQAIWGDTKTNNPKLSWVGTTKIQPQPGNPTFNGRWVWYWYHNTPTAGTKVPDSVRYPLMQYK